VTFTEDVINCDGTDSTIVTNQACEIPVYSTLKGSPYSLPWGVSVWATVTAVNLYGESLESEAGNGAFIYTIPDPPINLSNVPEITLATQIGLVWEDASENGGTEVIDYTVSFDQGIGVWTTFASSIVPQAYTAIGLSQGITY
jgi:hypothetical protein